MRTVTCTVYGKLSKTKNLLRISALRSAFLARVRTYTSRRKYSRALNCLQLALFLNKESATKYSVAFPCALVTYSRVNNERTKKIEKT